MNEADIKRFWAKVDRRGPDECWEWAAGKFSSGYGAFSVGGKTVKAHRLSLLIDGRDPAGSLALHSCHNPSCVNPRHLRAGDNGDNMRDKVAAGRGNFARGRRHGMAALSDRVVAAARILVSAGVEQKTIARAIGVSPMTISRAVRCETWRHVG